MTKQNKIITAIGGVALLSIIGLILWKSKSKSSDKKTATPLDEGSLQATNWDDEGGYFYLFPDGSQDYYRKSGTYVMSRSKKGNLQILAEYNNWNDENGYRYVFTDGTADYYLADGTLDHNGASDYLKTAPFGTSK